MSSHHASNRDGSIRLEGIKTAVVIGAGISGIVSAAHLLRMGINVTVIDRADHVGGAWSYSPQQGQDPPYPSLRPQTPGWDDPKHPLTEKLSPEEIESSFVPRGPVYANMKSRNTTTIMRTSLMGWPEGTEDYMGHEKVLDYLQELARVHHSGGRWLVQTSELITESTNYALKKETSEFDAVVVATGRYNIPRVPDIPGLSAWKRDFPSRISHSKQYRTPEPFLGKTVLIIGGFISAMEIANELTGSGVKVYCSARETKFDFRDSVDHEAAEKVPFAIKFTTAPNDETRSNSSPQSLDNDSFIPGSVILDGGRILEDIHHVIIATGYLTSYPFLGPVLEQPSMPLQAADESVIITADCRTVHNLHEDIFYIPDPTLAFIGVSHFASTFSLYDLQAQVLASVFAGRVRLPSTAAMRAEQMRRRSRVLPGTLLNSIFLLDDFVIRRLLEWVNRDLVEAGFAALQGPAPKWWDEFAVLREGARSLVGEAQDNYLEGYLEDYCIGVV